MTSFPFGIQVVLQPGPFQSFKITTMYTAPWVPCFGPPELLIRHSLLFYLLVLGSLPASGVLGHDRAMCLWGPLSIFIETVLRINHREVTFIYHRNYAPGPLLSPLEILPYLILMITELDTIMILIQVNRKLRHTKKSCQVPEIIMNSKVGLQIQIKPDSSELCS